MPLREGFEAGLGSFINGQGASCGGNGRAWTVDSSHANSGFYAVHAEVPNQVAVQTLQPVTPLAIPAEASAATLTFWHLYDFESDDLFNYDGGVLEVSTDGGTTWSDAGANITAGGYTGTLSDTGLGNLLAGRSGWIFTSPAGWAPVTVDLLPYRGASFLFRLRLGSDNHNIGAPGGWWVDDVEVRYDALSHCARNWADVTPYPLAVFATAAVGLDGVVYAFGGQDGSAVVHAEAYRLANNVWTPIAPLPEPRYGASALTDGRYVYVLGGAPDIATVSATLWRYDPSNDTYTPLPSYSIGTARQGAAYLDGVIYRIAGLRNPNGQNTTNSVEAYTIATQSWTGAADHPLTAFDMGALALDGFIYTAGGRNRFGASAATYRYDPVGDTWADEPIADLPGAGGFASAGVLSNDTWLLLSDLYGLLGWSPQRNAWRSLDPPPTPVVVAGTAVAGDAFYLVGGGLSDAVQEYIVSDCATPTATPSPATTPMATAEPPHCVGDCTGSGAVTIADLVKGVSIALNVLPLASCPSFDANQDGAVAVNELIAAVNNALNGCTAC